MPQLRSDSINQSKKAPEEERLDDKWKHESNGREEVALLAPKGSIGAELGVDTGQLTRRFANLGHFSTFNAVDKWDDHAHSIHQYEVVKRRLSDYEGVHVWRMTAQKWLEKIPDGTLGFIYIDCYAHTGQDDGSVLEAAWPKLVTGGVFSGDDYDKKFWPKTYSAVNKFANSVNRVVNVRDGHIAKAMVHMDRHPTWWFRK